MQSVLTFKDGQGNKDLNVVGSLQNPIVYSIAPQVNTEIVSLNCVLESAGASAFGGFSSALTNGILIEQTIGGVKTTVFLIQDKADLLACFNSALIEPITSSNFVGSYVSITNPPLILSPGDSITVTVQDDLSAIGTFNMFAMILQ